MNACAHVAAPGRRRHADAPPRQQGRVVNPKFSGPKGPPFAAGQLCHATGAGLVPWRQPGGWGMKFLTAFTAPFRPEPDVTGAADRPVLSSAAARETLTSLTAIKSALAKRDLC